jgi:ParB-like chromosome segregation protein Spo0J
MLELKVNPGYEKLLPNLPSDEYEALKDSIKNERALPLVVNGEGVILDGHHRYRVCSDLGFKPKIEVKNFPNKLLEKKFVIEANLRRRHLNDFQKAELAYPLLEMQEKFNPFSIFVTKIFAQYSKLR